MIAELPGPDASPQHPLEAAARERVANLVVVRDQLAVIRRVHAHELRAELGDRRLDVEEGEKAGELLVLPHAVSSS